MVACISAEPLSWSAALVEFCCVTRHPMTQPESPRAAPGPTGNLKFDCSRHNAICPVDPKIEVMETGRWAWRDHWPGSIPVSFLLEDFIAWRPKSRVKATRCSPFAHSVLLGLWCVARAVLAAPRPKAVACGPLGL